MWFDGQGQILIVNALMGTFSSYSVSQTYLNFPMAIAISNRREMAFAIVSDEKVDRRAPSVADIKCNGIHPQFLGQAIRQVHISTRLVSPRVQLLYAGSEPVLFVAVFTDERLIVSTFDTRSPIEIGNDTVIATMSFNYRIADYYIFGTLPQGIGECLVLSLSCSGLLNVSTELLQRGTPPPKINRLVIISSRCREVDSREVAVPRGNHRMTLVRGRVIMETGLSATTLQLSQWKSRVAGESEYLFAPIGDGQQLLMPNQSINLRKCREECIAIAVTEDKLVWIARNGDLKISNLKFVV